MAEQHAPDPARSYERAKPEAESGLGRLDNNEATPADEPNRQDQAVRNAHSSRQINSHELGDDRDTSQPGAPPPPRASPPQPQPDHSMNEEEPDGWDQAPSNIANPRHKRHPRSEGKGGTP